MFEEIMQSKYCAQNALKNTELYKQTHTYFLDCDITEYTAKEKL